MGARIRKPAMTRRLKSEGFDLTRYNRWSGSWRVRCSQCEALVINGVATHETGCPNARRLDREEE
jgi:hypothetical protein